MCLQGRKLAREGGAAQEHCWSSTCYIRRSRAIRTPPPRQRGAGTFTHFHNSTTTTMPEQRFDALVQRLHALEQDNKTLKEENEALRGALNTAAQANRDALQIPFVGALCVSKPSKLPSYLPYMQMRCREQHGFVQHHIC